MDMNDENTICYCRKCDGIIYTTKRNDTLQTVATQYGVTVNDIISANRYLNVYSIEEGDRICIPVRNRERTMRYDMYGAFETEEIDSDDINAVEIKNVQSAKAEYSLESQRVSDIVNGDLTLEEFVNLLKRFDK